MSERTTPTQQAATLPANEPTRKAGRRTFWLTTILSFVVVFGLYGQTLSHPYFWDDIVHFLHVKPRPFLLLLTNAEGLGAYYRPIPFILYKLLFLLQAPGSTLPSHAILLTVHATNAVLTGCLARRLLVPRSQESWWRRPILGLAAYDLAGLVAALFLACYPYAALPIAHVAAIMHPIVTLLMLGTALAALAYRHTGRLRWFFVAIGLAALAPYAHESGIMAGPLALLVAILDDASSTWRSRRWLWALPLASALFLPVWLRVPKMPSSFQWLGLENLLASTTFFTQGPTFPFQPVARLLIDWLPSLDPSPFLSFVGLPWWAVVAMWAVALAALTLAGLALTPKRRWPLLGIAVGWAFLAGLPSIVALPFPYITVSQRLLYSGAPGAAILWAAVVTSLALRIRRPALQSLVAVAAIVGIVLVPVLYVRREIALHELAFQPLEQLVDIAQTYPSEEHLVVNAVNWVNYRQPWYALGQEGVSVSAPYLTLDSLVWMNARTPARFEAVSLPAIGSDLESYYYSTINEDQAWGWADSAALYPEYDRIWITHYSDQAITVEEAGSVRQGTEFPPADYLARWGDGVFLVNAGVQMQESAVTLDLHWKILEGISEATLFRHVYDCNGQMLAQGDGLAVGRTLPFELLQPGSEVRDVRRIPVDRPFDEGCLTVAMGLYLPDGTRVPAWQADGSAWENAQVLLPTGSASQP